MSVNHPYRCSICNKITSRKENALRHNMKKHNGQGMAHDSANKLVYAPLSTLSSDDTRQKESLLFGIKDNREEEEGNQHGTNRQQQESLVKKSKSLTMEDDNETYYKDAGE